MVPFLMRCFTGGRFLCPALAAYLVIAVTGLFIFSAAGKLLDGGWEEPLSSSRSEARPPRTVGPEDAENFLAPLRYSLDCLAEEIVTAGKDSRHLLSSPRFETLRFSVQDGIHGAGSYRKGAPAGVTASGIPAIKNPVLVNLRT